MNKKSLWFVLIAAFAALLIFTGCPTGTTSDTKEQEQEQETPQTPSSPTPAPAPAPAATGITIVEGRKSSVPEDGKILLHAVVEPAGASQSVTWSSEDEDVATVSTGGEVTGVGEGEAYITATTSNGKTVTIAITVIASGSKGGVYADGTWTAANSVSAALSAISSATGDVIIDIFDNSADATLLSLTSGTAASADSITIRDNRSPEEKAADPLEVGIAIEIENVALDGLYFAPDNDKVTYAV